MKVLIVSGFLGAGKTTFIRELVRHLGRNVVIYENEFGDADVDARQLRQSSGLEVWETLEDCICCTGGRDFASSVLTIGSSLDPEYLIIEPTGVARLSGVLANIHKVAYGRIEVLAPIAVVDGVSWREQRHRSPDLFDDQVRSAGTIVVSKAGLAGFGGTQELAHVVRGLNPTAPVTSQTFDRLGSAWWDALVATPCILADEAEEFPGGEIASGHHHHHADKDFQSVALKNAWLPTPAHLAWQLDALTLGAYGHVDRAKGVVTCGQEPVRFDVVAHAWAMTADPAVVGDMDSDSAAVFIGKGLDSEALLSAFVA